MELVISRIVLLMVATALSLLGPAGATRADGPRGLMLIRKGESDGGVRWSQRARASGDHVIAELTLRGADGVPSSAFDDAHLSRRDPLAWSAEHGLDPADEQLLEGAAYSNVDHLHLELADGTARDITPSPAPKTARGKWSSLKSFRFFVVILPQQPAMMRLTAVDRRGKSILRVPLASPGAGS
jgi:hypothetical protein